MHFRLIMTRTHICNIYMRHIGHVQIICSHLKFVNWYPQTLGGNIKHLPSRNFLDIDEIQTVKMVLNGFNTHTQTLCIIFWNKKTKMQQCHSSYLSNDHNCCECHYNIICRRPLRTDQFYVCFYRVFAFVSALWSFVNRICTMLTILPHLLFINSC